MTQHIRSKADDGPLSSSHRKNKIKFSGFQDLLLRKSCRYTLRFVPNYISKFYIKWVIKHTLYTQNF